MQTCVIGGGGFLGLHVVTALLQTGRDVLVLGRRSERRAQLDRRAVYRACNAGDATTLAECLKSSGEIIDLAYATVPQVGVVDPADALTANLNPFIAMLDVAKTCSGLRKIVVASSGGTVYGVASQLPVSEDHPTNPISPYGITKLVIERYAMMYHLMSGVPVTVVRPANAYGPGQRPFIGQGLVATATGKVRLGEPVALFGAGDTIRDYVHVRDVASGIVAALDQGRAGQIYNIGSGAGRSNREVVEKIGAIAQADGYVLHLQALEPRGFDVPANILDAEKLATDTNWRPVEDFEAGLRETWEWMGAFLASS